MIKNIIFDFGGVILTLNPEEALRRFIELGVADAREQMSIYGHTGIFLELENGSISADEFCQRLASEAQAKGGKFPGESNPTFTFEEAQWAWAGFINEVSQNKLDCLLRLKRHYNICLLSNINPFMIAWAESDGFSPDHHSIKHYFNSLYYSYELKDYKPAPSIFQKMLRQGNMLAEECLFLDDSPRNIQAAAELGMHTMLIGKDEDWVERLEATLVSISAITPVQDTNKR